MTVTAVERETFAARMMFRRRMTEASLAGLNSSLLDDDSPTDDVEVLACMFFRQIGAALLADIPIPPLVENWTRAHPMKTLRAARAFFDGMTEDHLSGISNAALRLCADVAYAHLTGRTS